MSAEVPLTAPTTARAAIAATGPPTLVSAPPIAPETAAPAKPPAVISWPVIALVAAKRHAVLDDS